MYYSSKFCSTNGKTPAELTTGELLYYVFWTSVGS